MPSRKPPHAEQDQNRYRTHRRKAIAAEHELLFVKPVCQSPGKYAHQNIGGIRADRQRRRAQRRPGLFVEPQRQGIGGHGTAELGKALGAP